MPLDPEERRARRRVAFDPIFDLTLVEMREFLTDLHDAWQEKDYTATLEAAHNLHANVDRLQMSLNAVLPIDFLEKMVSEDLADQMGVGTDIVHEMRTMGGDKLVEEIAASLGNGYLEMAEQADAELAGDEAEEILHTHEDEE